MSVIETKWLQMVAKEVIVELRAKGEKQIEPKQIRDGIMDKLGMAADRVESDDLAIFDEAKYKHLAIPFA